MSSHFAPEVAKNPKSSLKPQIMPNSVRAYCFTSLAMQLVFDVIQHVSWYIFVLCVKWWMHVFRCQQFDDFSIM